MTAYRHSQTGWVILGSLAIGAVVVAIAGAATGCASVVLGTAGVLALVGTQFHRLTVTVTDEAVEVAFGPGLLRRRVPLGEIRACEPVRNRWWYGWGIRWIPGGWLWNCSGLDAVELRLAEGRRLRIGTDEPWQLCDAIQRQLEAAR